MPTTETEPCGVFSRRSFIVAVGAATTLAPAAPAIAASKARLGVKELSIVHARTGERFKGEYFAEGGYIAEQMAWLDWVMRDVNIDRSAIMSNDLIDLMHRIQGGLRGREMIITSGYRCKETNRRLRRAAKNSLHLKGEAVDFYCKGVASWRLARIAVNAGAGGVGTYRRSSFIHADIGPRRSWRR